MKACQSPDQLTTLLGRLATWRVQRCATGCTHDAVFDSHKSQDCPARLRDHKAIYSDNQRNVS